MGHDSGTRGQPPIQARRTAWIETFRSRSRRDLRPDWRRCGTAEQQRFVDDEWGAIHRPDWAERGLLIWPRGRRWLRLEQRLCWPEEWRDRNGSQVRLCLSWWAEAARLWVDGALVHEGDLFDTACRWTLPERFRAGDVMRLQLELCSPLHDDGALISSTLDREPGVPNHDPTGILLPEALQLHHAAGGELPPGWQQLDPLEPAAVDAVAQHLAAASIPSGAIHWLGHAHLDLAWLWPVADTWLAAERTFRSALDLMQRWPQLRFAHSTPALYDWLQRHRPALFASIRRASQAGRWEPINGPWVENDCVLVSTASLWQQFTEGQEHSIRTFPEWSHHLAWLPDSFGFSSGLPAVASRTGVRWFCTHKLAWNATNPFPHRLFRWRGRGGAELLSLMLPPIGRRGDPLEMLQEQRSWREQTGVDEALWIPGVGDHGGGPTEEMLEQMVLWQSERHALPQRPGSLRSYLEGLETHASNLPVWSDELYLELHRGCATSRPDQKRHNRTLERLLREQDTLATLLSWAGRPAVAADWRPLLFQQFHDILPGTSIPEVFEQAEPVWLRARRQARSERDAALQRLMPSRPSPAAEPIPWLWIGLQPLKRWSPLLRLPSGCWRVDGQLLPQQPCSSGGVWVQPPAQTGISGVALDPSASPRSGPSKAVQSLHRNPLVMDEHASGGWRFSNGLLACRIGRDGLVSLQGCDGVEQLSGLLQLCRYRDQGEFWDAWDLAADYREHPLSLRPLGPPELRESGPLLVVVVQRFLVGTSELRLDLRLRADCPWIELVASVNWQQRHELLRLELPLAQAAVRLAADTSGGVIERPASPHTDREQERWEVPVISWFASQSAAPGGGLAVLLDGPQGVDASPEHLGMSLLRGATWPDPSADRGRHRFRIALLPLQGGWAQAGVPQASIAFREPGWLGPLAGARTRVWLPALPLQLCPVALKPAPDGCRLQLLNPGASRCRWIPGDGWKVGRDGVLSDAVVMAPGELAELQLLQSS